MSGKLASLYDYKQFASLNLPRRVFQSLEDGAGDQVTKQENEEDFIRIKMKLRGMANMKYFEGSQSTILGHKVSTPISLGGLPQLNLYHPDAEIGTAQAAKDLGIVNTIYATGSSTKVEDIFAQAKGGLHLLLIPFHLDLTEQTGLIKRFASLENIIGIVIDATQ